MMWKKIKRPFRVTYNLIQFFVSNIFFIFVKREKQPRKPKTLLLLKLVAIGDYVLAHNFLQIIRNSEKYRDYEITFCGNSVLKEFAEFYDKGNIDHFIWLDRKKYYFNLKYRFNFLRNIYRSGYSEAIEMSYNRELLYGDLILHFSNASELIGSTGSDDEHDRKYRKLLTDSYYTKLIPAADTNMFEFYRNREFFEGLLGQKLSISAPTLVRMANSTGKQGRDYIIIATGAQQAFRRWSKEKFAELAQYLLTHTSFDIVLSGNVQDAMNAEYIRVACNDDRIINNCGKSSLPLYAELISGAKLVIANDTGAIHIAAAFGTPFVCISNGNHFGRFHPYPKEIFTQCRYVYPPTIESMLDDYEAVSATYGFGSSLDIEQIKAERVIASVCEILDNEVRYKS